MGVTKLDEIKAPQGRVKVVTDLPTTPNLYFEDGTNDVDSAEWRGGELVYLSTDTRFYLQTATSGTTATWVRYLTTTSAA